MKLIVGLGNPGRKYEGTRHNVGFDVVSDLARRRFADPPKSRFEGALAELELQGEKVLLLWPHTYMNLSGTAVGQACHFYRLAAEEVLVVCDDFHLPLAKLRFRRGGSAGGQKGLEDILRHLGTDEIARLRVGVGPVPPRWDPADFVLSRFSKDEGALIEEAIQRGAAAIEDWVAHGTDYCMNQYNG